MIFQKLLPAICFNLSLFKEKRERIYASIRARCAKTNYLQKRKPAKNGHCNEMTIGNTYKTQKGTSCKVKVINVLRNKRKINPKMQSKSIVYL
ncbi:hypothetical protein EAG11_20225 [Flavobacterium sp. 140616W15]|nr:hypothetical protein EAG11_20225 [Flavobacterium sp. 140616W15]